MRATRRFRQIISVLGLVLAGACGTGEAPDTDIDGLEEATLAPEAEQATGEQEEAAPTSARFELGRHYQRLSPTQPTSTGPEQVEVAEIFWYGCPHCYELEPLIARWAAEQPDAVSFVRIPAVWNPVLRLHARAFYTAQALDLGEAMHDAFFTEIHENRNPLDTREAIAEFFARFDVEREDFERTFDSYDEVHSQMQRAEDLNRRYRVTSVPTIVVNGKYTSDAGLAGSYEGLIELIDELVAAEQGGE